SAHTRHRCADAHRALRPAAGPGAAARSVDRGLTARGAGARRTRRRRPARVGRRTAGSTRKDILMETQRDVASLGDKPAVSAVVVLGVLFGARYPNLVPAARR